MPQGAMSSGVNLGSITVISGVLCLCFLLTANKQKIKCENSSISYWGLNLEKPQLTQLNPMPAAHVFSLSQSPEEEALTKILEYAKTIRLSHAKSRLFGRNIYPTDQPEPHGYEYYLTGEDKIKLNSEVGFGEVNGGLYAVLEIKNLFNLAEGWKTLFSWVEANGHVPSRCSEGSTWLGQQRL